MRMDGWMDAMKKDVDTKSNDYMNCGWVMNGLMESIC